MTLDIRGGLKTISISTNQYVVFDELLSNAIDSFLIRKKNDLAFLSFFVSFDVELTPISLFEEAGYDLKITCEDNGAGFSRDQIKAFVTMSSTYKDNLNIQGIGKCKGLGRIQFFHFFKNLKIESTHKTDGKHLTSHLDVNENTREISEESFIIKESLSKTTSTKITLYNTTENARNKHFLTRDLKIDFSAEEIKNHLFINFLQRLIILKGIVGEFQIVIKVKCGEFNDEKILSSTDLPSPTSKGKIPLICQHRSNNKDSKIQLIATRYSFPAIKFANFQHEVALCANSALVMPITKKYLKNADQRKAALDGCFELVLIESDFLEQKVNERRDGFTIPESCSKNEDIDGEISLEDIIDSLEDYVFGILTPKDFNREQLIESTRDKFGISKSMLNSANIKVHYGDTEDNIAKRVLRKFQEDIVKDTSEIFNLKNELLKLDPTTDSFRDQINKLSWKYTSTIKKVDMANLSQLVVRRSSIIEVLEQAIKALLPCQNDGVRRNKNERIIHNIFFPTGKDNTESVDHDIWILNEEYHYFEHIASDKALSTITLKDNQKLFDKSIDSSLEELFKKNNKDHEKKRPDIAIFNQEGSAIIIEFKAPGVELQEHIPDLIQYARLLSAKSNGRINKFYGYLIGDCLDETRMPGDYTLFPSGLGYFRTESIRNQTTGMPYGELYSEVLFYDQFVDRAKNRLKVYKDKLNIVLF